MSLYEKILFGILVIIITFLGMQTKQDNTERDRFLFLVSAAESTLRGKCDEAIRQLDAAYQNDYSQTWHDYALNTHLSWRIAETCAPTILASFDEVTKDGTPDQVKDFMLKREFFFEHFDRGTRDEVYRKLDEKLGAQKAL